MKAIACTHRFARGCALLASLAGAALAEAADDIRDIRGPKAVVPGSWFVPAVLAGVLVIAF